MVEIMGLRINGCSNILLFFFCRYRFVYAFPACR